jgi:hypothetical protein
MRVALVLVPKDECAITISENIADYGKLGHAEVVGLKIPGPAIQNFSEVYFDLFNPEGGARRPTRPRA